MLEKPDDAGSREGVLPGDEAAARGEASIVRLFVIVRLGHLLVGAVCAATAWRSYRRPKLMLAALGLTAVESSWLMRRWLKRGAFDDSLSVWVDSATSAAGLLALAAATTVEDRTTWVNWMSPLAYTTAGALALGVDPKVGGAGVASLGGTYLATVASSTRRGGGMASTAIANTLSYGGFFVATRLVVGHLRRSAVELEDARSAAVESAQRLAAERERNRQHRLVHDSALQTLEAVAAGWGTGTDAMFQGRARDEAVRLRTALRGDHLESGGLAAGLRALADDFRRDGMEVELVVSELDDEPAVAARAALCDAATEALRNVAKHAGTSRVVMRAVADRSEFTVTIRDHGAGFPTDKPTTRFGILRSIVGRMREAGGEAQIQSAPGEGTLVTLTIPRPTAR